MSRRQQAGGQLKQPSRHRVAGDQAPFGSPEHDPVADVGQHERQLVGATGYLRLRFGQRRDVRYDADVAAVGQRRGAHIQSRAIRPPPLANLWAGDVERHLLGEDLVRGTGPVLACRGTPSDHVLQVIANA